MAERVEAGDESVLADAAEHPRVQALAARVAARAGQRPDLDASGILATQLGKPRCGWTLTQTDATPVVARPGATVVGAGQTFGSMADLIFNRPPGPDPANVVYTSTPPADAAGSGAPEPAAANPAASGADTPRKPLALTQDGDSAEMYLYGDIDSWGGWWGVSAEEFLEELEQCTAANLTVHLNSYGGEVFEGLAIKTALSRCKAKVTVTVDSIAASIASVIAMAGETVVMADPSMLMIHDPWMFCVGDAAEMLKSAAVLDEIGGMLSGVYGSSAGRRGGERSADHWREEMRAESWYGQDKAVDIGLADRVERMETEGDDEPMAKGGIVLNLGEWPSGQALIDHLRAEVGRKRAADAASDAGATGVPIVEGAACPMHHTATTDEGSWDAGAETGKLDAPMTVDTVKAEYALYDADAADDDGKLPKSACSLPHHVVSDDGTPGAAHLAGVRNALARLPQTQGFSEEDRNRARDHLQAHLDDGNDDDEGDETEDHWAAAAAALTTDDEFHSLTEGILT